MEDENGNIFPSAGMISPSPAVPDLIGNRSAFWKIIRSNIPRKGIKRSDENRRTSKEIEQKTGIPAQILTADTEPDLIVQARSLIRFRDDQEGQRKKSTAEQFSDWLNDQLSWNPNRGEW